MNTRYFRIIFFILSTLALFLGFYRNQWRVVLPGKFREFQKDSQSLVMGRLVMTRQQGLFAYGGLLGRGNVSGYSDEIDNLQYDYYLKYQDFSTYNPYFSQSGGQGIFFGILDSISPLAAIENLRMYRIIASLALALTLAVFLDWLYMEIGLGAAALTLFSMIISPWLTMFGRNLFYFTAFFYLPMVALTLLMHHASGSDRQTNIKTVMVVFAGVFLKCFMNGYDFILPSLGMLIVPFLYYAIKNRWGAGVFLQKGAMIGLSAAAAVVVALGIQVAQIASVRGSAAEGVSYIIGTFNRRTLGNSPAYLESNSKFDVSASEIIGIYLRGDQAVWWNTGITFADLILFFAVMTLAYAGLSRRFKPAAQEMQKVRALATTTWLSILVPIFWYVIFREQSYVHTHTNFLSWYMPYVPLGFALCGHILQRLVMDARKTG